MTTVQTEESIASEISMACLHTFRQPRVAGHLLAFVVRGERNNRIARATAAKLSQTDFKCVHSGRLFNSFEPMI